MFNMFFRRKFNIQLLLNANFKLWYEFSPYLRLYLFWVLKDHGVSEKSKGRPNPNIGYRQTVSYIVILALWFNKFTKYNNHNIIFI